MKKQRLARGLTSELKKQQPELWPIFKSQCALDGTSMVAVMTDLVRMWLEKRVEERR